MQETPRTARLADARAAQARWERTCGEIVAKYAKLITQTPCPHCPPGTLCATCPHYSLEAVQAWNQGHGCKHKALAMTFDVLMKELTGVITTRRPPPPLPSQPPGYDQGHGYGNTFMGITRFIVAKERRAEFNAGIAPDWWDFDRNSAPHKRAVESWRFLGWTSMRFRNLDEIVMFVFDCRLRADKLLRVAGAKRKQQPWPQPAGFAAVRDRVLRDAIRAESALFGAAPDCLAAAEFLNRRRRQPWPSFLLPAAPAVAPAVAVAVAPAVAPAAAPAVALAVAPAAAPAVAPAAACARPQPKGPPRAVAGAGAEAGAEARRVVVIWLPQQPTQAARQVWAEAEAARQVWAEAEPQRDLETLARAAASLSHT